MLQGGGLKTTRYRMRVINDLAGKMSKWSTVTLGKENHEQEEQDKNGLKDSDCETTRTLTRQREVLVPRNTRAARSTELRATARFAAPHRLFRLAPEMMIHDHEKMPMRRTNRGSDDD
eukprot:scaffold60778_cov29-Tisochrysis_lutea.AAC.1